MSSDEPQKVSWAEDADGLDDLPPSVTKIDGSSKTVTEYAYNKEGEKIKTIMYYKIEKIKVSKSIAARRKWKKCGGAKKDPPGPSSGTTIIGEEVFMEFYTPKDKETNEQDDLKKKLMDAQKGHVKCRLCKEDHWTKQCPYKDKLEPLRSSLLGEEKEEAAPQPSAVPEKKSGLPAKYIPPSMREGASRKGGETMMSQKNRDETATVRVTNLSENTREQDLQELFKPFGEISRIFLAKDKVTMASKGFAFINYKRREDAAKAINYLHGYGYDYLILNVEWAKPSTNQ